LRLGFYGIETGNHADNPKDHKLLVHRIKVGNGSESDSSAYEGAGLFSDGGWLKSIVPWSGVLTKDMSELRINGEFPDYVIPHLQQRTINFTKPMVGTTITAFVYNIYRSDFDKKLFGAGKTTYALGLNHVGAIVNK